ncbi:MAG: fatty acid desaturase [Candidatus Brocadiia bacterium]
MTTARADSPPVGDTRTLHDTLRAYRGPRLARSLTEIAVTAAPFALLWFLTWTSVTTGYWAGLALTVPAAGFLVRLFMIQHDCAHGSFFRTRAANNWVGRVIGILTLTPHDLWRHSHARHHAGSGNLDRPQVGAIETLTVRRYYALPRLQRLQYRLYRHPLVLFIIGPVYVFFIEYRWPLRFQRGGWMPWLSTMTTNAGIVALWAGMMAWLGVSTFLLVHLPIALIASFLGVWLFYVQHQFEETYWAHSDEWRSRDAALHGSSHYVLPGVLRWFSANIGVHHVHHLCSGIPSYRLPEVLRDHPELAQVSRITLSDSLRTPRLALWDEEQQRLISFREARLVHGRPIPQPA